MLFGDLLRASVLDLKDRVEQVRDKNDLKYLNRIWTKNWLDDFYRL